MMRLIKRGLMFGNLIPVTSAGVVARYNRALKHLTGKETKLTEFHIDISGYSPEIGHEIGDEHYLNPQGCNQQFILLTTDQKTAPLLESGFSTSRSILKDYIQENEEELFALTAREAVAGELIDSVFSVNTPRDLTHINQITIEADTTEERVAGAQVLQDKIARFINEDDAWWDDVLIAEMVELAKQTGNIQRHPISLTQKTYSQGNYYTSHFGGIYIFRDVKSSAAIARKAVDGLDDMNVARNMTFADRKAIARFLYEHHLAELVADDRGEESAAIIRQKLDFIVISVAASSGDDLGNLTRQDIRKLERVYAKDMPPAYHGLLDIWRWAREGAEYPELDPDHPAYFYAFRAAQHKDKDLVNMLLSDLSPLDFRQLFICHKTAFYDAYSGWSEAKKEYVARFIEEEYAIDKAGARETLFGAELRMDDPEPKSKSKAHRINWKRVQTRDGSYLAPRFEGHKDLRDELDWHKKPKRKNKKKKDRGKKK